MPPGGKNHPLLSATAVMLLLKCACYKNWGEEGMLYFLQARTLLCHEALTKRKRMDRGSQQTSCHMWFSGSEASFSTSANSLFLHNIVQWDNIRSYVIFEEGGIVTLYPFSEPC